MSAPLTPLLKKDGVGIRPVAVGEVLRRLVSKIAMKKVAAEAIQFLMPFQLGVGVSSGVEAIVHGLNRVLTDPSLSPDTTLAFVDFKNAFNCVSRMAFSKIVLEEFPSIASWVLYSYGCQAVLFVGGESILSMTGVQQGDPLGPLLFALALQPLLRRLAEVRPEPMISSYLDDMTVGASHPSTVGECLDIIKEMGPQSGLFPSSSKSSIWCPLNPHRDLSEYCSFASQVTTGGVELLGAAVSPNPRFGEMVAGKRVQKCITAMRAVMYIKDPQICLLLIRSCLGMKQLNYCWRTLHNAFLLSVAMRVG
jgi:hypothetical protein